MAKLLTGTRIYGTGTVDTQLFVNGTEQATSTTTGALEVVGGAGIGGNLHVGGISVSAGVQSTNIVASGTLGVTGTTRLTVLNATSATFSGTLGVTGTSVLAGVQASNIVASGTLGVTGTTTLAGLTLVTNTTSATSITTGALTVAGGVGIGQDLRVGGVIYGTFNGAVTGTATNAINILGGTAGQVPFQTAPSTTSFYGPGTAGNVLVSNGAAAPSYNNTLILAGTTAATSTATGALQVRGGVGIGNALVVGGKITGTLASGELLAVGSISNSVDKYIAIKSQFGDLEIGRNGNTNTYIYSAAAGTFTFSHAAVAYMQVNSAADRVNILLTTASASTITGALTVAGGVGIGRSLFVQESIVQVGATYSTLAATYNLINTTATTVNFAGAATALNVGATTGSTNVRNNLSVAGNLTVQGTTTIVDSTVTNIADPIVTLGGGAGNTAPTIDDNKDRGIAFKWFDTAARLGFFGYDDSTGHLTYIQTATITNEVVSGTKGAVDANLAGGTAMSLVYQSAVNTTAFLAAGSSGFILQTNGTGSAPTWVSAAGIGAGSATNADAIRTVARTGNANHFLTFVDSNNAANAYESLYTTSSFTINPATGNVGIGTSLPTAKLHVTGANTIFDAFGTVNVFTSDTPTTDFGGAIALGGRNGQGTDPYIFGKIKGAKEAGGTWNGYLSFGTTRTNSAVVEAMRISSLGNVSIGITDNLARLAVGGEIVRTANGGVDGTFLTVLKYGTTTDLASVAGPQNRWVGLDATVTAGTAVVNALRVRAYPGTAGNAAPVNVVDFRGDQTSYFYNNVGIGTGSPLSLLDVAGTTTSVFQRIRTTATGSTNIALRIQDGTTGSTDSDGIYLGRTGADSVNYLWTYENEPWVFATNNTERIRITAAGGVAFGGASNFGSTGQVLQSNGNSAPTWVAPSGLSAGTATNADAIRTVARTTAAAHFLTFVDSNNAANAYESLYTTSSFVVNPDTGRVGIGSTNLTTKLHVQEIGAIITSGNAVNGTSMKGITVSNSNNGDESVGIWFGTGPQSHWSGISGQRTAAASTWGTHLSFYTHDDTTTNLTSAFERVRITSAGNVGIGTAAPDATLTVNGAASFAAGTALLPAIARSGDLNTGIWFPAADTVAASTAGVERVQITATGLVGVGVTTPQYRLDVNSGAAGFQASFGSTISSGAISGIHFGYSEAANQSYRKSAIVFERQDSSARGKIHILNNGANGAASATIADAKMTIQFDGGVGIGTTSTTNRFEVAGTAGQLFSVSDSFTGTIFSVNDVSGIPSIEVLDTGLVKIAQYNGQVAINTPTALSSMGLTVNTATYITSLGVGTAASGVLGEIRATNEITAYFSSDQRLKENVTVIENPIEMIKQIRGVYFDWTDEHMTRRGGEDGYFVRKHDVGVIAQEVEQVLPQVVGTRNDGFKAVKYDKIVALLIEAVKEQQSTIETLTADLAQIKQLLDTDRNNQV